MKALAIMQIKAESSDSISPPETFYSINREPQKGMQEVLI